MNRPFVALTCAAALTVAPLTACSAATSTTSAAPTVGSASPTATVATTEMTPWAPAPGTVTTVDAKSYDTLIADLSAAWARSAGEQVTKDTEQRHVELANKTCTIVTSHQSRPAAGTKNFDRQQLLDAVNAVFTKHHLPTAKGLEKDMSDNVHVRSVSDARLVDLSFAGNGVTSVIEISDTAAPSVCTG